MSEILEIGKHVYQEDRWPHGERSSCPDCGSRFRITIEDTELKMYTVGTKEVDVGPQWEPTIETRYTITIICPVCGKRNSTLTAPSGWTPEFAKGGKKKEQFKGYGE